MGIRIQPKAIEIPACDPFKNDLLKRKEPIQVFTEYVGSIEGGGVMAIDAPWGRGKTTFLRMWGQHLRNEGFHVAVFNAWETDFSGEPLVALSSELSEAIESESAGQIDVKRFVNLAKQIVSHPLMRIGISLLPHIGPAAAEAVDNLASKDSDDRLSGYKNAKNIIREFKVALDGVASKLADLTDGKPMIVVIDELDRCRPSYAIELLEVAKHLFNVNGVVFVLALDRRQLAHSVRVLYGGEFGAEEYLKRFFDADYHLPDPELGPFIESVMESTGVSGYAESHNIPAVKTMVFELLGNSDLSLRTIEQAIHRLGLILTASSEQGKSFVHMITALLVFRTLEEDLYLRFINRHAADREVLDTVFSRPGFAELRDEPTGQVLEATILGGFQEMKIESPILKAYREHPIKEPNRSTDPRAEGVNRIMRELHLYQFPGAVERLEFLIKL